MPVERKTLFPEHLENVPVFLLDKNPKSRYFKITDLPDTFTGGKNSFSIQGSTELVSDTLIHIEIKDAQGIRIYHEVADGGVNDYYEGVSKPVAVYVYDDTAFGECTITILGEVSQYEIDGVIYDIPDEWKGIPNIRWQSKINVYPFLANTTRIRFYKRPKVFIEERTLPIYRRTIEKKIITGYCRGFVGPNITSGQSYADDYYYTIQSIAPSSASLTTGSYLNELYGGTSPYFNNTISASALAEAKLVDTYLELNNIVSSDGWPAQGPRTPRTFVDRFTGQTRTTLSTPTKRYTKWRSKVKRILGNNSILATGFGLDSLYTYGRPLNNTIVNLTEAGGVLNDPLFTQRTENPWAQNLLINDFAYAEFTASYDIESYAPSRVSSSYAYIKLTDLETFSGDVYRIKVYAKSKNDLQGYTLLEDLSLEQQELLEKRIFYNEPYYKTGFFTSDRNVRELWSWSYADIGYSNGIQPPFIDNTTDSLFLQNSVVLIPASEVPEDKNIGIYRFWNVEPIDFVQSSDYKVTLLPLVESYGTSSLALTRPNTIDIYMSGSAFVSGTKDFSIENAEYGKKIGEIETFEQVKVFDTQEFTFSPLRTGTGNIQFIVRNGKWKLSEISITPLRETAISPPEYSFYTYPEISIPSQSFDFRFEFFDINYNYVPIKLEKSIQFTGTNVIEPSVTATVYKNNINDNQYYFTLPSISGSDANEDFLYVDITTAGTTSDIKIISASISDITVGARTTGSQPNSPGQLIAPGAPLIYPGLFKSGTTDGVTTVYRLYWEDFTGSFSSPTEVYDIRYRVELVDKPSIFDTFVVERRRSIPPPPSTTTTTTSTTTSTTTIPITGEGYLIIRNSYLVPEYSTNQPDCGIPTGCGCYKNSIGIDDYKGDHKIVNITVGGTQVLNIAGGGTISYPIYSDSIYNVIDTGPSCELNWTAQPLISAVWTSGSIGASGAPRQVSVTILRNTVANQFHANDIADAILRLSSVEFGANVSDNSNGPWVQSLDKTIPNNVGNQTYSFWIKQTTTQKNFFLQFFDGGNFALNPNCCFMPGTMINMADGSTKAIENILEGDTVLSYNENNSTIIENTVTNTIIKHRTDIYKIVFNNGNYVEISPDHPIWSENKGWVSISPINSLQKDSPYQHLNITQLEIGDVIKTIDGNNRISYIEKYKDLDYTTYTFGVLNKDAKSYFANGIVSHNGTGLTNTLCGADGTFDPFANP